MAPEQSSAACLDRWFGGGPRGCSSLPPPPRRAFVPAVPPPRRARTKGRVGCASVPRELGVAAPEAEPVVEAAADTEEDGLVCEACSGAGWLLCDFCKGKKNNVKSETSRVYRRCPTCKGTGVILCPRCRAYKCITFPDSNES